MKFFANKINGSYLRNILPSESVDIDWVRAAIAYGSDWTTLIENCLRNRRRLDIWMRYDHTVPVAPALLRKFLSSTRQNIFCYLIPDVLHAKVIWWKNYGVYVGSANLTDRAWISNIEFGVFLPESTLEAEGGMSDIERFFDYLASCEAAIELDEGIVEEQEKLWKLRSAALNRLDKDSESQRRTKKWEGPAFVSDSERSHDKQRELC